MQLTRPKGGKQTPAGSVGEGESILWRQRRDDPVAIMAKRASSAGDDVVAVFVPV